MIAETCRFDPETGAPLSEEKNYPSGTDRYRTGVRTPVEHPDSAWKPSREGALTNGELRSSREGLLGYFERVHRIYTSDPNPRIDMAAATALRYLKSGDHSTYTEDSFIWYALAERIHRQLGIYTGWMLHFAVPRCPYCASECCFEEGVWHKEAVCASQRSATVIPDELKEQGYEPGHGNVDSAIRERVINLYNAAFSSSEKDGISELRFR